MFDIDFFVFFSIKVEMGINSEISIERENVRSGSWRNGVSYVLCIGIICAAIGILIMVIRRYFQNRYDAIEPVKMLNKSTITRYN